MKSLHVVSEPTKKLTQTTTKCYHTFTAGNIPTFLLLAFKGKIMAVLSNQKLYNKKNYGSDNLSSMALIKNHAKAYITTFKFQSSFSVMGVGRG